MTRSESASSSDAPSIFIILLNWNGLADTLDCLRSLEELAYPNAHVVVVDNGSVSDEAARIGSACSRATVLRNDPISATPAVTTEASGMPWRRAPITSGCSTTTPPSLRHA